LSSIILSKFVGVQNPPLRASPVEKKRVRVNAPFFSAAASLRSWVLIPAPWVLGGCFGRAVYILGPWERRKNKIHKSQNNPADIKPEL
jgi:hypothetical protein